MVGSQEEEWQEVLLRELRVQGRRVQERVQELQGLQELQGQRPLSQPQWG